MAKQPVQSHESVGAMTPETFIDAYTRYWLILRATPREAHFLQFDWFELPDPIDGVWAPYAEFLQDHAQELANMINQLQMLIRRLIAWQATLADHDESDRMSLFFEFAEPLAVLGLNLPYAIRSRFIFSVSHLCHQANKRIDPMWVDDLPPDERINFTVMQTVASRWERYADFRTALASVSNPDFLRATDNFRNKFHHRYPARIEYGLTQRVARCEDDGGICYGFGGTEPIEISNLIPLLEVQHMACVGAFREYQNLVQCHLLALFEAP